MTDGNDLNKLPKMTDIASKQFQDSLDAAKPMADALEALKKSNSPLLAAAKGLSTNSLMDTAMGVSKSPLADALSRSNSVTKMLEALNSPATRTLREFAEGQTATSKLYKDIIEQQQNIDLFALPIHPIEKVRMPDITIPHIENPVYETNKRLANIEKRFHSMETIAVDSAKIATNIQQSALDFLVKFEKVAEDNDKSVKKTVWLGKIAIFVALLTAIVSIAYSEFKAEEDRGQMQRIISDMNTELSNLKEAQLQSTTQITDALAKSDSAVVGGLTGIKDAISKERTLKAKKPPQRHDAAPSSLRE